MAILSDVIGNIYCRYTAKVGELLQIWQRVKKDLDTKGWKGVA